jgi:hypothetical protein
VTDYEPLCPECFPVRLVRADDRDDYTHYCPNCGRYWNSPPKGSRVRAEGE